MRKRKANAQEQIRWQVHKSNYESYLHKGSLENCGWGRVFWTTDLEKCKITDLVWESKRRFGLVVRLIAIKYNERLLCYLSSYINLLMSNLWFKLDLWSRLCNKTSNPGLSPRDDVLPLSRLLLTRCLVAIVIVIIICFRYCSSVGSRSH